MLKLVLGALLLIAGRQWRGRPRDDESAEAPKWMRTIDSFTAPRSAAFGVALSAVNSKQPSSLRPGSTCPLRATRR